MKKLFLSLFVINCWLTALFAMPGFQSFIPDFSGEYVYYKDSTFTRESYIGILYYDDSTLELRYAAPKSKTLSLPEKEIDLLVSIDPNSETILMTGERINTKLMPNAEDTDIVNYLHDILYEFNARRRKVDNVTDQNVKSSQDYAQFGGDVLITFDAKIPLFNIKNIENGKGEKVLEIATFGQLTSSEDKSFINFYGFPEPEAQTVTISPTLPAIKKPKTPKSKRYRFEKQAVVLDENWEQKMDNFWTLGDDSLVTISQIPVSTENRLQNEIFILRKMLQSAENSYTNLLKTELSYNDRKCQYKIREVIYQPLSATNIINTKLLTSQQPKKGFISETSTNFDYFSISTYEEPYNKAPTYFEKIVKNYKSNN